MAQCEETHATATCGQRIVAGDVVRIFFFEDDREIGTARVTASVPGTCEEWCEARLELQPLDEKAPQPKALYAWDQEGGGHYIDGFQTIFYVERAS